MLGNGNLSALPAKFQTFCNVKPISGDKYPIPAEFNWLAKGFVSPVVDQKKCDSGYVMAATAALESQYMMRGGVRRWPLKLSAQSTLHCMGRSGGGGSGCQGGTLAAPIRFMKQYGAPLEGLAPYTATSNPAYCYTTYPYAVKAEETCFFNWLSEVEMQRLLLRNGPASVPLDASAREFRFLKNSAYTGPCSHEHTTHAALLIGWTPQYWILKNSFGNFDLILIF